MNHLIQTWLLQSAVIFLLVGSFAGLLLGALLVLCPHCLQRFSAPLNRWVSTRQFDKELEHSFTLDPWFHRHRKITGVLILLGALYVLYYFTVAIERDLAIAVFAKQFAYPAAVVAVLLDALVLTSLLGALCAVLVALFMLVRPSLLRDFEQRANSWVSLRRVLKPVEVPRQSMDELVFKHSNRAGIVLVLGSLYTVVVLTMLLGRYPGV